MSFNDLSIKSFLNNIKIIFEKELVLFQKKEDVGFLKPNINIINNFKVNEKQTIQSFGYVSINQNIVNIKCFEQKNTKLVYGSILKSNIFEGVNVNILNDDVQLTYPMITLDRKAKLIELIKKDLFNTKIKFQEKRTQIKKQIEQNNNKEEKRIQLKYLDEITKDYQQQLDKILDKKIQIINKI